MRRIDKVLEFVTNKSELNESGVTTTDVANELSIQRTNASKDLNHLVEEGKLIKISGRPVRYKATYREGVLQAPKIKEPLKDSLLKSEVSTSFESIIGASGSMKTPVEQAKASILYPPKGLNCLITGGTGTGKTHFVQVMFQFAKEQGLIEKNKELVIFNCADYANNSELLMSQLFGFAEGAFTGANQAKEGLLHQADGGMLFLDEVHRLPPEGQEMIFSYMDFGTYHRLGETNQSQTADVRIVCATTENVSSFLLQTFLRRIPIHIQLPSFMERPAKEKIELVQTMLGFEATRLQRKISLTDSVVKALIGSVTFGNVGQLKSNVQLMCAYCFLKQMDHQDMMITLEDLSPTLREGLMLTSNNQSVVSDLNKWLDPTMVVQPNQNQFSIPEDAYELPYNLYDIIGDKATILQQDGVNQETINHYILTDINVHLKSFYRRHGFTFENDNRLSEIIDNQIIEVAKVIREKVEDVLSIEYSDEFIYALSLHIGALLKRVNGSQGERKDNISIKKMVSEFPEEYSAAKKIHSYLSETFSIALPASEVDYLTVLLVSQRKISRVGCVGIVVAAHGISTASSMVQVVQQLMGYEHIQAVDMPLSVSPKQTLEKIISAVLKADSGSGVLLLVDMGSLANFGDEIQQKTNVKIKTIDMVSTPLVLEASRKASYQDGSLDLLFDELSSFRGYGRLSDESPDSNSSETTKALPPAIITFCASGEGTAIKMKQTVEKLLEEKYLLEIEIIPLSIVDAQESMKKIQKTYDVIFTVGIQPPDTALPHLSIAKLLGKDGEYHLNHLVEHRMISSYENDTNVEINPKEMCFTYMQENALFLNPNQFFEPLWILSQSLIQSFKITDEEASLCFSLVLHIAGSIERVLHNECLSLDEESMQEYLKNQQSGIVRSCLSTFEDQFNIILPKEEDFYIYQILAQVVG